jgi:uncharacterized protein (UPF0297 family)
MSEKTMVFNLKENDSKNKIIMKEVYQSLVEKGYNPTGQLIGYILSEDPTYITSHNGARALVSKIDRFDLLAEMLEEYLK